jgi:hypothetical protein
LADRDKRIEFELPEEGSNRGSVFIPPLAMDSTLQELLKNNVKLKTNLDKYLMVVAKKMQDSNKQSEALDELIKTLEKKSDSTKEETKEAKESLVDLSQTVDGASDAVSELDKKFTESADDLRVKTNQLSKTMVSLSKDFTFTLNAFDFVVKSLMSFGTITGGYLVASVGNTGNALNSLTDVGQAFGDVTGEGIKTTIDNINALNRMGLTVDQATQFLQTFSRTSAVLGQTRLTDLGNQFLELTNYGADFGVTLDDALQLFQEDQEFRSRILNRDQMMDQGNVRRSAESIKQLRLFSTALGISTDELRQGAMGMLTSNQSIQSLIMQMGQRGPEVSDALKNLVAGLEGAGIDDQFIQGILEVASVGATGASDFLNKILPNNPEAYASLTDIGLSIRNGAITLNDVPNLVNSILGTFSTIDRNGKIQALLASEVGADLQGPTRALIESSRNAEMAAANFAKLAEQAGMGERLYSEVQDALNQISNSFKKITSTASVFQTNLVRSLGESFTSYINNDKKINVVLKDFSDRVGKVGKLVGEAIGNFITKLGGDGPNGLQNGINKFLDTFSALGERFAKFVDGVLDGFLDKNNNIDIMGGITNYIKESIAFVMPIVISAIGDALVIGIKTLFSSQGAYLSTVLLGLFAGKVAMRAIATGIAGWFLSSSASMTASQTGWWTGFSTMMTTQFSALMVRLNAIAMGGSFVGPMRPAGGGMTRGAGFLASAGAMATSAAPYLAGGMILKDGFDIVAGTDGGATKENIGGFTGGLGGAAIGAAIGTAILPAVGTLLGAAIGGLIGNFAGETIGSNLDEKNAKVNQPPGTIAVQDSSGNVQYIQTAQPQQPNINRIKYHAIEDIANRAANRGGMNSSDAHRINDLSDEAKILTQILVENKTAKKLLNSIEANTKELS